MRLRHLLSISYMWLCYSFYKNIYLFVCLFIYLFWLCQVLVAACGIFSCGMRTLSCGMHAGSSSLTRDWTPSPCIESTESYPLDYQGSPFTTFEESSKFILLYEFYILNGYITFSSVCMGVIYSTIHEHSLCFSFLVTMNNAIINILVWIEKKELLSLLLGALVASWPASSSFPSGRPGCTPSEGEKVGEKFSQSQFWAQSPNIGQRHFNTCLVGSGEDEMR